MAKVTKKSFLKATPSEIGKMKNPELRQLLLAARQLYAKQEKMFKKYESTVWSPALDKMQDFYEEKGEKPISQMNKNQMRSEIFRLQDFFEAETSTLPGARKLAVEQDKRIFGENEKTGKPNKRLTLQQRTELWAAFEEYRHMNPVDSKIYSNFIQQALGEMIIDKKRGFSANMFDELNARISNMKYGESPEMENYQYGAGNVFSGTRPDNTD